MASKHNVFLLQHIHDTLTAVSVIHKLDEKRLKLLFN